MALVALAVTLLLGILILVPHEAFVFSTAGTILYRDLHDLDDLADQHRFAAYWLDAFWENNRLPIERLTRQFEIAAGALVVQVVCWILAVAATLTGPMPRKPLPPPPPPPSPDLGRPEVGRRPSTRRR